jgi:hypothetical protein
LTSVCDVAAAPIHQREGGVAGRVQGAYDELAELEFGPSSNGSWSSSGSAAR